MTLRNSKIDIYSIYNSPKSNIDPILLKPLLTSGNLTLIAGDYDAKHPGVRLDFPPGCPGVGSLGRGVV